jgi:ABC-2 type transport system permease protein
MLEFARYESRRRVKGAVVLAAVLSAFAGFYVAMFPSMAESIDLDALLSAYPEALLKTFGVVTLATIEGFLASELYTFAWQLLVGLYFVYSAAGLIAGDVEHDRLDLLLALPVSRARLGVEKFLSLLTPLAVVSVVVPIAVYAGTVLIDEPIAAADLAALHLLSIPYFLTCAGIGFLASVVFDRTSIAQRVALGVLFALFLVESLVTDTDYEWLGAISPTHYLDPNAVLIRSEYDLLGGLILLVAAVALVGVALAWFQRKDVN